LAATLIPDHSKPAQLDNKPGDWSKSGVDSRQWRLL